MLCFDEHTRRGHEWRPQKTIPELSFAFKIIETMMNATITKRCRALVNLLFATCILRCISGETIIFAKEISLHEFTSAKVIVLANVANVESIGRRLRQSKGQGLIWLPRPRRRAALSWQDQLSHRRTAKSNRSEHRRIEYLATLCNAMTTLAALLL